MIILGMHIVGHEPNFSIIRDGKVKRVLEGERLTGDRYGIGMPLVAFKTYGDEDFIKGSTYWSNVLIDFLSNGLEANEKIFCVAWSDPFHNRIVELQKNLCAEVIKKTFLKHKHFFSEDFDYQKKFYNVPHHLCHAAAAFFTSPYKSSLIFSFDGQGTDGYTVFFHGEGNKIKRIRSYDYQLGHSYVFARKIVNEDFGYEESAPGKLMGLAAYGKLNDHFYNESRRYLEVSKGGKKLLQSHIIEGVPGTKDLKKEMFEIFNGIGDQRALDWLASFQKAWSDLVLELIKQAQSIVPSKNICLTGGCSLNVITNRMILDQITKNVYVLPNPSDCGLSMGAALYVYYVIEGNKWNGLDKVISPYLGLEVRDTKKIDEYISHSNYIGVKSIKHLAKLLHQGKIIGIVQGLSEIGPRALGNRSILCSPLFKNMKDDLNSKVKFREWYRPFAAVTKREEVKNYFDKSLDSPYMSFVVNVNNECISKLSAINHVDNTVRVQTITKDQNTFLWELLDEFKKESGFGVLLNTSFNTKGKAILSTISEALSILDQTQLDGIYYEGHLWLKP